MTNIIFLFLINFMTVNVSYSQEYIIHDGDTINVTDNNGMKQGKWIYFADNEQQKIAEKGIFVDNIKDGIWTSYYPNGNIKTYITFTKGAIDGNVKIYTQEGVLQEEGNWKDNRWISEYRFFYENGNPEYVWQYSDDGKRTGTQKYFYDNNKLHIEGVWNNGKEEGEQKEYYKNGGIKKVSNWTDGISNGKTTEYYTSGEVKIVKIFNNGVLDENSVVFYAKNSNTETNNNNIKNNTNTIDNNNTNNKNNTYNAFTGNGFNKLFNSKKQLTKEGIFENGVLLKGKKYYYDSKGELKRTDFIEKGKIIRSERI